MKCRFSRMMWFTFCFNASVMTEGRPDLSASWTSVRPFLNIVSPFSDTGRVRNMFTIDCNKSSVNFTGSNVFRLWKLNHASHLTVGGIWYRRIHCHNVKTFAARTSPGNYLHSTKHTTWLIWYNETTAQVVCANVLYFPNNPHTLRQYLLLWFYQT